MAGKLQGAAIQSGTITTTQLSSGLNSTITAGGGPKITSLRYPGDDTAANTVGGQTIYILGSGFKANSTIYINGNNVPSVSYISASNLSFTGPALSAATYPVYLINPEDGATAILVPGFQVSGEPTWVTGATLSEQDASSAWNISLSATGDGTITYALKSGSTLPSGISLASNGVISGTLSSPPESDTTYNFTVIATDSQNQDAERAFSVTASTGEGVLFANNVLLIHADGTNNKNNHTFLDSSNNNLTITRYGNATQGSFSPFSQTGWSNYFDGSGDYFTLSSTSLNLGSFDFTVEAWVQTTSTGEQCIVGSIANSSGSGAWMFNLNYNSNKLRFYCRYGGGTALDYQAGSGTFPTNTWTHIAATRSGSNLRLFIDGTQVGSTSTTLSTNSLDNATTSYYIGRTTDGASQFTGYISNLRVIKGNALYTSNFTPPTAALTAVANTQLLTCKSNRLIAEPIEYSIINAKVYGVYGAETRAANYTVQYSTDNVSWSNAFSGVMQTTSCGLFTGTGGGGSYGSYKYWRYLVGSAVTGAHHPRVSRITLSTAANVDYDIVVFATDNCADNGTIPASGQSYTLSGDITLTRNGDVSVQAFSPFAPTTSYSTSSVGGSAYFDGTGDYLTAPDNNAWDFGTNNFTIETWIYPTTSGTTRVIGSAFSNSGNDGWSFELTSANKLTFYAEGGYLVTSTGAIDSNTWTHVVVSRSGTSLKLFINGTTDGSVTNSTNIVGQTSAITISATPSGTQLFVGYQSNFRVVTGTAVYTSDFTPPTAPLTNVANTQLLCNFTNAGIFDQTAKNVLETVGNAKLSTAQYKYGSASMYFDGSGDWIYSPTTVQFNPTQKFTVEFWTYPNANTTVSWIVGSSAKFYIESNAGTLYVGDGTTNIISTAPPSTGAWTHVALTYDGTTYRLFYNGTSQANSTTSLASNVLTAWYIGARHDGTRNFDGYIDDLRITKGYARYTANFTAPSSAFKDK